MPGLVSCLPIIQGHRTVGFGRYVDVPLPRLEVSWRTVILIGLTLGWDILALSRPGISDSHAERQGPIRANVSSELVDTIF